MHTMNKLKMQTKMFSFFHSQKKVQNIIHRKQLFSLMPMKLNMPLQKFDYFLVIDFEATCNGKKSTLVPQEIIEFPVLKVKGNTFEIESVFHEYVQPNVHKTLTSYCIELTGINQDMVDGQPQLKEVLEKFHMWMEEENLLSAETNFAFVTYTDCDLVKFLPSQCEYLGIDVPLYMKRWINIQQCFVDQTGFWPTKGLKDMMKSLNVPHVGRFHSGIDDCKNIVNAMKSLAKSGFIFSINCPRIRQ